MIVCTSSHVAGQRVAKTLGLATGSTIRARHIGKDILAVFKNIIGGEIEEYSKMLGEAREQALEQYKIVADELAEAGFVNTDDLMLEIGVHGSSACRFSSA